jgi:opacity protein-like surface antigen
MLGGLFLAFPLGLLAQAPTQPHAIEVAGVFGAAANLPSISSTLQSGLNEIGVSGLTVKGGSNFDWFLGGSVGYAISSNFLVVGEFHYNNAGSSNISYGSGSSAVNFGESLAITDFTGGVHWQIPVSSKKLVPYLAAGVGGARAAASVSGSGLPASVAATSTGLSANFGGGLRYYIRDSWGVRPEVTFVRIPGQNYVRFGVGVFWQSKN